MLQDIKKFTPDFVLGEIFICILLCISYYGSITVGAPSILAITEMDLSSDFKLALTWNSNPGRIYSGYYSLDMIDWGADLDDGVVGDDGETTTKEFDLSLIPALDGVPRVYFRVEQ